MLARLGGLLDGAEIDSYEVSEARQALRRLIHQLSQLASTSERVRQSSADVREVDRQRLIPELAEFDSELDRRFAEIGRMLEGHPPERGPISVPLDLEDKGCENRAMRVMAATLPTRVPDNRSRPLFSNSPTVERVQNTTAKAAQ